MALRVELDCNGGYRSPASLRGFTPQPSHPLDDGLLRWMIAIGLDAFHSFASRPFAFPRGSQLEDEDVLLEFRHGPENLPDKASCRVVAARQPITELTGEEASLIAGFEVIKKNAEAGDRKTDIVHKVKLKDQSRFVEMAAKHFRLLEPDGGRINVQNVEKLLIVIQPKPTK